MILFKSMSISLDVNMVIHTNKVEWQKLQHVFV